MDPHQPKQKQVAIPSEQILPSMPQEKALEELENPCRGTHFKVKEDDFVPLLIAAFQNGFTVAEACSYAGIAKRTYYRRLKENPDFAAQMEKAQMFPVLQAKKKVVNILMYGSDRDAGAMARWFLEKREPEIYGTKPITQQNNQQYNFYLGKNEKNNQSVEFDSDNKDNLTEANPVTAASGNQSV